MYIWWFVKLLVVLVERLKCQHARTAQLVRQQRLASIINKKPQIDQIAAYSHHYSLWQEHGHWGIGIQDISSIQAQAIPPPSWGSAPSSDYRQLIEYPKGIPTFNSTENALIFTFMIIFSDYGNKGVRFDEIYPFGCRVYLSSDICQVCWAN